MRRYLKLNFIFLIIPIVLNGQFKEIKGQIIDSKTMETLPYASICLQKDQIGTNTDETGKFILSVPEKYVNDTVIISFIGYNTLKLGVNNIDGKSIELIPKVYNLNEILITPKKKQIQVLNQFKIRDVGRVTNSGIVPIIYGTYFPYKEEYNSNFLKEIRICISSAKMRSQFGVRIYKANPDGTPGQDLLNKPIIVSSTRVFSHFINYIETVKVDYLKIEFPKSGLFVGMERLIIPSNAYSMPGSYSKKNCLYAPNLQNVRVDSSKQNYGWRCYNNTWKRMEPYTFTYITKKHKSKTVTIYEIPAISVVLSD